MHGPRTGEERFILKHMAFSAWIEEERSDMHGPWTEEERSDMHGPWTEEERFILKHMDLVAWTEEESCPLLLDAVSVHQNKVGPNVCVNNTVRNLCVKC